MEPLSPSLQANIKLYNVWLYTVMNKYSPRGFCSLQPYSEGFDVPSNIKHPSVGPQESWGFEFFE